MKLNHKILIVALLLILADGVIAVNDCRDTMFPFEVPCNIITFSAYAGGCPAYTISFYGGENGTYLGTKTYGTFNDSGRCYVAFNFTALGDYIFNDSFGSSGKIYLSSGDDMFTGIGILLLTNIGMFIAIAWLISRMKVEWERLNVNFGKQSLSRIKTDIFFKTVAVIIAFLINLIVVGYLYFSTQYISESLTNLTIILFIFNIIGIIAFSFIFAFKMFQFPFSLMSDALGKFKR